MFSTALLWLASQVGIGMAAASEMDTVRIAATVARCESSARFDDGAIVLTTAQNRARKWRRSMRDVLTQRSQYATACPAQPRTFRWRHLALGIRAVTGALHAPPWASRALFYCARGETRCEAHRRGMVGSVVHDFYAEAH